MNLFRLIIPTICLFITSCGGGTSGTGNGDVVIRASLSTNNSRGTTVTLQSLSESVKIEVGKTGELRAPQLSGVTPLIIKRACSSCSNGNFEQVFNLDGISSEAALVLLGITLNESELENANIIIKEVE